MQIVSLGDNLHEISDPVFWEHKKNITNLSSAEFSQRVVKVKQIATLFGQTWGKYCNKDSTRIGLCFLCSHMD